MKTFKIDYITAILPRISEIQDRYPGTYLAEIKVQRRGFIDVVFCVNTEDPSRDLFIKNRLPNERMYSYPADPDYYKYHAPSDLPETMIVLENVEL